ncbi:MAG: hypothetical protein ACOYJ2_06375 [Rickettsiales bacterium]
MTFRIPNEGNITQALSKLNEQAGATSDSELQQAQLRAPWERRNYTLVFGVTRGCGAGFNHTHAQDIAAAFARQYNANVTIQWSLGRGEQLDNLLPSDIPSTGVTHNTAMDGRLAGSTYVILDENRRRIRYGSGSLETDGLNARLGNRLSEAAPEQDAPERQLASLPPIPPTLTKQLYTIA